MGPCCILGKCGVPLRPDCGNIFFDRNIFTAEILHQSIKQNTLALKVMPWNWERGAAPASSSYRKRWMCARAQWRTLGPSYWLVKDLVGEGSWQDMSGWLSVKPYLFSLPVGSLERHVLPSVRQSLTRNCMEKCSDKKNDTIVLWKKTLLLSVPWIPLKVRAKAREESEVSKGINCLVTEQ